MNNKVVTRFPPSPTGYLHIGSARTALFNYLFAKHNGGKMTLRFEDTDRERSKKEFEDDIVEGLAWLGIGYEGSILRQSERTDVYRVELAALIESGHAYEAEESTTEPGKKVIRFKNPNKTITFNDAVRGEIAFDTTELRDFVIARSMDEPLYHLAVVVDDAELGITHIIRGEDHISNTQRQILILEALGLTRPEYAHIPLILAPDRSKLSKRHGAVSVVEYRTQGFIPEALYNYLALLGWNPGGDKEVFTLEELTKEFTLERVHKGGAVFDVEKLKWFNHEHLKRLSDHEFIERLSTFADKKIDPRLALLLKERSQTLREAVEALAELDFLTSAAPTADLILQGAKADAETVKKHLTKIVELLYTVSDSARADDIKSIIFPYASRVGRAGVLWPLRVALSGKEKSPDPFTIAALLGKEETIKRIEKAQNLL